MLVFVVALLALISCGAGQQAPSAGQNEQTPSAGGDEKEQQASAPDPDREAGTKLGHPALGDESAPVTMIEYGDYQ